MYKYKYNDINTKDAQLAIASEDDGLESFDSLLHLARRAAAIMLKCNNESNFT